MREQFDGVVINELRRFDALLEILANEISEILVLSNVSNSRLSEMYSDVKAQLRCANATGTIDGRKKAQTESEARYFAPAVRQALIALRAPTNSNPHRSNWISLINDARREISYHLHRMERDLES